MVLCAAINCDVKSGDGVSLYKFPSEERIQKIWVTNMRREGTKKNRQYAPTKHSRLCIRHFESDQFVMNLDIAKEAGFKFVDLKPDAVPTLFNFENENGKREFPDDTKLGRGMKRRKSMAVIKRQAVQTLNSMSSEETQMATEMQSTSTETDTTTLELDSATEQSFSTFNVFTQTIPLRKEKIQRRHVMIQTSIIFEENPKPKTRTIETQTDFYDSRHDLNSSFITECDDEKLDPDWTPNMDISGFSDIDTETDTNAAKEKKFVVFESCLLKLFQQCRVCGCSNETSRSLRGSMVKVETVCGSCGNASFWHSQPMSGTMPLGNLILAGAMMFSGSSPVKAINLFHHAGIEIFSFRTYTSLQSAYLVPAINSVYQMEQLVMIDELKESELPLILGGDARCCSPGHTAKYGSYSVMNLRNSKVLDIQLVQSNEVKNSYAMELEGLKRCLEYLLNNDLQVSTVITDRHSQVKAYMKQERPDIVHLFDCWHVAKGIYKKLEAAGKKKYFSLILEWARSISNHLYWCAASSAGDGEMVKQKWQSILNHVLNVHEGHGDKFTECQHGPLEEREWFKEDTQAYHQLEKIVNGKLLLKDIVKLSPREQTYGLEAFHKVVCHFAPKLVHFFHSQMEARLYLAVLHFNENSSRPQAITKTGTPMYTISYPKSRKGEGVAKEVKQKQTFEYVDKLFEEVLFHREVHNTYRSAKEYRHFDKARPGPISSSTPRRQKEDVIKDHISRFNN